MSSVVSALNGKVEARDVTVRDFGLQGMISVRGDMGDTALQKACRTATGATPPKSLQMSVAGDNGYGWMSPDEALLLVPHGEVMDVLAEFSKALEGKHFLVANVSDARARIVIKGPFADEVIAKLAPVDLHPETFAIGDFRRSRLGQVAAAFWKVDAETFHVICFRSVADYAFDLLVASAKTGPVGYFR